MNEGKEHKTRSQEVKDQKSRTENFEEAYKQLAEKLVALKRLAAEVNLPPEEKFSAMSKIYQEIVGFSENLRQKSSSKQQQGMFRECSLIIDKYEDFIKNLKDKLDSNKPAA
jgi:hypothetical protein